MSKQCYGMVISKNGTDWVKELASTEEYERYCSYLVYLARQWKVNTEEKFIQYYYSLYYNPEWKPNEQYYQGNRSMEKEPFFDSDLDDEICGFPDKLQTIARIIGENSCGYGYCLAKIGLNGTVSKDYNKATNCFIYNCVTIKHIITPQEIWKSYSNNHTFEKHILDKRYDYALTSIKWSKY